MDGCRRPRHPVVFVYNVVNQSTAGDTSGALEVLDGFSTQVAEFQGAGKLTPEQATALTTVAEKITSNLGYWQ